MRLVLFTLDVWKLLLTGKASTQVPTVAGVGIHKDVTQFEAPAGAALIYDSR